MLFPHIRASHVEVSAAEAAEADAALALVVLSFSTCRSTKNFTNFFCELRPAFAGEGGRNQAASAADQRQGAARFLSTAVSYPPPPAS